jgi:hypothetical protein
VTDVAQDNTRTFATNWTGTASIELEGDAERAALAPGDYLESEVVITGAGRVSLAQNLYAVGDDVDLKYRTAESELACEAAEWSLYSAPFDSLGYTQVRLEVPA